MPHCAVLDHTDRVETALYSWDFLEGTAERLSHTDIDCMVSETHVTLALEHFSGGILAFLSRFVKGKLVSCMPYLPKTLPASMEPVLEVRLANKPRGMKWRTVHEYDPLDQSSRTRPATDRDTEVYVKPRNLTVTCEMANGKSQSKNVGFRYFMRKSNHRVDFILDFQNCETTECNVTLTLTQKSLLEEIIFTTWFDVSTDFLTTKGIHKRGRQVTREHVERDRNDDSRTARHQADGDTRTRTSEPNGRAPKQELTGFTHSNKKPLGARPKTRKTGDPATSGLLVYGTQVAETQSPRTKEPDDEDESHQNITKSIKSTERESSSRPNMPKTPEGSCQQVPMVPSSDDELSSTSSDRLTVHQLSSSTDDDSTTAESKLHGKLVQGRAEKSEMTDVGMKKKKKSRGARAGKKNRTRIRSCPPPPIIVDETATSSELDQMKPGNTASQSAVGRVDEPGFPMVPANLANMLQPMGAEGRMQNTTTYIAIHVGKMTINKTYGNMTSTDPNASEIHSLHTIVPPKLRHDLGVRLNGESPLFNDWKGLATKLGLDDCITSLEKSKNPTEQLIIEAERRQKIKSLDDLAKAFNRMNNGECEDLCRMYDSDQRGTCTEDKQSDEDSDSL